jgi:hypothetical protein
MILTAITIAINVLPIAGVLLMNQNNLIGLVIPPEIDTVLNDVVVQEEQLGESLGAVNFVGSNYDAASRKATLTFEMTNPLQFDLVIDSMSADVRCDEHDFPLGYAVTNNPVDVAGGETATVVLEATLAREAMVHLLTEHAGAQEIDVELTGISVNLNGIAIQTGEILKIPDVPVA